MQVNVKSTNGQSETEVQDGCQLAIFIMLLAWVKRNSEAHMWSEVIEKTGHKRHTVKKLLIILKEIKKGLKEIKECNKRVWNGKRK